LNFFDSIHCPFFSRQTYAFVTILPDTADTVSFSGFNPFDFLPDIEIVISVF